MLKPRVLALVVLLAVLAACPSCLQAAQPQAGRNDRHYTPFFSILMRNPFGLADPPRGGGEACGQGDATCGNDGACCSGACCGGVCCANAGDQCCECCGGGSACQPAGPCSECGACACFARDTKVHIRESPEPVAIRDLLVGQNVLCYEAAGPDMLAPGAAAWCQVKNFIRADDTTAYPDMVRLTVRAVDGSATTTTTTVSSYHIMHLVTDSAPKREATTAAELGASVNEIAINTRAGQLVAMPTSPADHLNTTFKLGVIERVEVIEEFGKYVPGIEHPWIWADGVVQPIWGAFIRQNSLVTLPVDMHAANALKHMLHAPLWMTAVQPRGTPGRHAHWGNSDGRSPLLKTLEYAVGGKGPLAVAGTANVTRALEWFAPRYHAWKADPSKAITEADVFEVLPSLFEPVATTIDECAIFASAAEAAGGRPAAAATRGEAGYNGLGSAAAAVTSGSGF